MNKTCTQCAQSKSLSEFYAHPTSADGLLGKCKTCKKQETRQNYYARHEQYLAYEQKRAQDPVRRAKQLETAKTLRNRAPDRYKARMAVTVALRRGLLQKQPCEVCGSLDKVEAHHTDYSRPLDVQWLCFQHHREVGHGQVCSSAN